ncbi:hypothetical protein [Streptomyces sp. ICBB 8177]|uniref:hypothetical protein n=1 Tax=Streptomyces sp. ICBB 8177 TaxID=563922 RepID=UPI000D681B5D|nr:hypothetical protein [Streptomyces sp. ICBB 8177]PWI46214.1 hypothetical protein CK485_00210 [Streptomyces sp. ICBB 8177]
MDRLRAAGWGQRPRIERFQGREPSLWWGNTTQSPAQQHALQRTEDVSTAEVLVNLAEVLELPGQASDYHYALQSTVAELRRRRQTSPELFGEIERLCRLDLQLALAVPDAVSFAEGQFVYIGAVDWLLEMYLTEGLLADALWVAEAAEHVGAGDRPRVRKARERAARVAAEDAAV